MSLPTRTYETVKALAQAKLGGMIIDGDREVRFRSLLNAAARNAFDDWNYWPRWIVFAEPRTIARSYIDFNEDSFHVFGAGSDGVDGLYVENGIINGKVAYRLLDSSGSLELYNVQWDNSSDWELKDANTGNTLYAVTDTSATPPLTGWVKDAGEGLGPLLVDLAEMGTILDVNIGGQPFGSDWDYNKKYFVDGTGARILNNNGGDKIAYVTYKKNLTDVYGDGTGGTTSDIPNEWSEYMARYAARDMQLAELTGGDLQGTVGAADVERARESMLVREEAQNSQESIARRIYLANSNTLY